VFLVISAAERLRARALPGKLQIMENDINLHCLPDVKYFCAAITKNYASICFGPRGSGRLQLIFFVLRE
jgi:hypothetical protein